MKTNTKRSGLWRSGLLVGTLLLASSSAHADWCQLLPGWTVVTHGTRAENVMILGRLQGAPSDIWIQLSSPTLGKANVAVALGAQLSGRDLSIYVDSAVYTCASFPSWAPMGEIIHFRVL